MLYYLFLDNIPENYKGNPVIMAQLEQQKNIENAKLKGKEGMRSLFRSNDYFSLKNYNYRLLTDIPQEILNEIFTGKRKKYNSNTYNT